MAWFIAWDVQKPFRVWGEIGDFYVQVAGGDWRLVSGGANVAALNTENLLGVSHIKGLKSSYTIKFV